MDNVLGFLKIGRRRIGQGPTILTGGPMYCCLIGGYGKSTDSRFMCRFSRW